MMTRTSAMLKHHDEEVRQRIILFIKKNYAKTLGEDIKILEQPDGLLILHKKYCEAATKI